MLASLWLHPGPSGHARQRQNAILKFSLVYSGCEGVVSVDDVNGGCGCGDDFEWW